MMLPKNHSVTVVYADGEEIAGQLATEWITGDRWINLNTEKGDGGGGRLIELVLINVDYVATIHPLGKI